MSSLGSTVSGNRFQVGAFWYLASLLLRDDSLECVELESENTKVIDDVICRYKNPRPIQGTDYTYQSDYYQIKYHVNHTGALSHTYLIDEDAVSTKKSILVRFFEAYNKLQDKGNCRLNLVTNWRWNHTDPLAQALRRAHFNTKHIKGKKALDAVALWKKKLNCNDIAFEAFANRLLLKSSFDLVDQREALNDRLELAGLLPIDMETEHSPYDDLGLKLIEAGKTVLDRDYLLNFAKKNKIYIKDAARSNSQQILAIRSFKDVFDSITPAYTVNVSNYFEKRHLETHHDWNKDVYADLEDSLQVSKLKKLANPIEAHIDAHLSIAFAAGRLLSPKKGFELDLRQRTRGSSELWKSKTAGQHSTIQFNMNFDGNHNRSHLIVSVAVSQDIHEDVSKMAKATLPEFDFIRLSTPTIRRTSVAGSSDAWALAEHFSNLVVKELKHYKTRPIIHLYLGAPVALAFRMGQESTNLGPLTLYEFDFEGTYKYTKSIDLP